VSKTLDLIEYVHELLRHRLITASGELVNELQLGEKPRSKYSSPGEPRAAPSPPLAQEAPCPMGAVISSHHIGMNSYRAPP
jgi:hypothetical protein